MKNLPASSGISEPVSEDDSGRMLGSRSYRKVGERRDHAEGGKVEGRREGKEACCRSGVERVEKSETDEDDEGKEKSR